MTERDPDYEYRQRVEAELLALAPASKSEQPTPPSVTAGVEKELVEALKRMANYPKTRRDEMSVESMRILAREALAAYEASRQSSGEGK